MGLINYLYPENDLLLQETDVKDIETDTLINTATIKASICKDPPLNPNAAVAVDKGGGKVGIPCTAHGLADETKIIIIGTVNYDGSNEVDNTSSENEIVITDAFVAETFNGNEEIYSGIKNGFEISLTHEEGDADGYYDGILPNTMSLTNNLWYWRIIEILIDAVKAYKLRKMKAIYRT